MHLRPKWTRSSSDQPFTKTANYWGVDNNFKGTNTSAEIVVHPNGKFLYASNRGDDSLAVFAIDQTTGRLMPVEHVSSGGNTYTS